MDKFKTRASDSDPPRAIKIDTLLVLEKTFDTSGQQWVENLNILEQLLVEIIESIMANSSGTVKANFILRRLPTYTAAFVNKNEYAVIIEDFDFTLSSPVSAGRDSVYDKAGRINLGQVEIFSTKSDPEIPDTECNATIPAALNSHDFFNKFAAAFQKVFTEEIQEADNADEGESRWSLSREKSQYLSPLEKVQLLGPHLLHEMKCNLDVERIFTLTQPRLSLSRQKKSTCRLTVDPRKLILVLELDCSVIVVRPCLFHSRGHARLNSTLLERIPLFHPTILSIGESLTKGCLLSPATSDTLWVIQFWPCESHLISTFHPSSTIARIFKLYGSFCLSPLGFWHCLNESFIVGVEGLASSSEDLKSNIFNTDFLITSFLYELERYPNIDDWGPASFAVRFSSLLKTAVDACEKGFYPHYFTKANILRGLWRNSSGTSSGQPDMKDVEKLEKTSGDVFDYGDYEEERYKEHYPTDLDELDDDFGFQLDRLSVEEEDKESASKLTSDRVHKVLNPFSSLGSGRSSIDGQSAAATKPKPKSLSRKLGVNLLRRFSTLNKARPESSSGQADRPKSMTDIASGFEEMVNQMRREQTINRHMPSASENASKVAETSFTQKTRSASVSSSVRLVHSSQPSVVFDNEGFQTKESIYSLIFQFLNEISISEHFTGTEMNLHVEKCKKVLYSQGELISIWCQITVETPKPKYVCPHTFTTRQIQYISLVVQTLAKCSPNNLSLKGETLPSTKMPSWEISGDILRTVLYQLRSEVLFNDSLKIKEKQRQIQPRAPRKFSFKSSKSFSEGSNRNSAGRFSKFSFRKGQDICKGHVSAAGAESDADLESNTQFALEDPETAATHRLLQWLWQLRNSEIGRLSVKAQKYIEALHQASHVNSHFLEQFSEQKILRSTAIRSAVAVSRIMADEKYPPHVPLLAASKKGWLWAEMVLSLVTWNHEKGVVMKAEVPSSVNEGKILLREIQMTNLTSADTTKLDKLKKSEPDTEAATLAFHSELATPLGWNDFEDPRRPGPQTVSILIFSSLGYFHQWENISGNIVQTMVRLQKFNNLQHVGSLLYPPHRKTALNEVRKLNKSVSFRAFQFDDNVMTKTFRRLASLRNTRSLFTVSGWHPPERQGPVFFTCQQIGCTSIPGETTLTQHNGKEVECTRF